MTPSSAPLAPLHLRTFLSSDHPSAYALWARTPGVGLGDADHADAIAQFLMRNPGLSFTAWHGGKLAGTILCGHDGRRGLIHHLVVDTELRRRGLGARLVAASMAGLSRAGIGKCHFLVFADNTDGQAFWRRAGAAERVELKLYSLPVAITGAASAAPTVRRQRYAGPTPGGGA